MQQQMTGKTALVTAAAAGIGRASALAMARAGAARVWAADIDQLGLAALASEHAAIRTRPLDVRDAAAVRALAAEVGAVDALFNCAGVVHHGALLECAEADWDVAFDLNVKSMYRLLQAFLPAMIAAGGGSVINMSSVVSSLKGAPNRCAYGATKAAVIGLTKSVAADYLKQNIRCNAVCPGTTASPSLEARIAAQPDATSAREAFVARQPMGRLGRPEEIAALVLYLASDASSFTTGQIHVIDGGWSL